MIPQRTHFSLSVQRSPKHLPITSPTLTFPSSRRWRIRRHTSFRSRPWSWRATWARRYPRTYRAEGWAGRNCRTGRSAPPANTAGRPVSTCRDTAGYSDWTGGDATHQRRSGVCGDFVGLKYDGSHANTMKSYIGLSLSSNRIILFTKTQGCHRCLANILVLYCTK